MPDRIWFILSLVFSIGGVASLCISMYAYTKNDIPTERRYYVVGIICGICCDIFTVINITSQIFRRLKI